ncbi:MAG: cadherin repeat domain-containing protein [Hormoscilla sp. SP5CHS1]|nr:cadherin repeat domain-containing protein [Hormoscilla sp. SP5CHS1]
MLEALNIGGSTDDIGRGIATDSNGNAWATGEFQGNIDIDGDGNNDLTSNGSRDSYLVRFSDDVLRVDENVAANTVVGTFSTTDPDTEDTFTYQLVAGTGDTDNVAFTIVEDQLRINSSPDFETKSSYSILVQTTDAGELSYSENLTININDVNENSTDFSLSRGGINFPLQLEVALNIGGSISDEGYGIATDSNGNVWATGEFQGNIDIDGDGNNDLTSNGSSDSYVAKFDSNGNLLEALNISKKSVIDWEDRLGDLKPVLMLCALLHQLIIEGDELYCIGGEK